MQPTVAVVLVAAGSGTRLGKPDPKAFVRVGDRSLLAHSLESVLGMAEPTRVIVVAPSTHVDEASAIAARSAGPVADLVTVVAGGGTRQDSVAAGLAAVGPEVSIVLVHDAARAFTPPQLFDTVVLAVRLSGDGVIPVLPVTDTIKAVSGDGAVRQTLDRSTLAAVQTPQGFPRAALQSAYAAATQEFTDDAALYAASGRAVTVVDGDPLAFKVTTAWDLRRAEQLQGIPGVPALRTGIGVDVHAFDDESPLWLGGVYWPDEPGLKGHSDGDAVCHAICDALLSAAGLGDIGGRFGTADDRFAGAHGEVFIAETVRLVTGAGFGIVNVAVQVIANHPKLAGRRVELERNLTALVTAPVSVSATTTDGLGFAGRGEGVTAIATALLAGPSGGASPGSVLWGNDRAPL